MDRDRIDQIIDKYHCEPSYLIQVLLDIQAENNWLPKEALERVAERLQVPMTRIQHIATFYKAFSLVPKGRHQIHVCIGCCALGPVVEIDGKTHGKMGSAQTADVLKNYE
jgi:NADH-quinone oxidoreductase subunit E